MKTRFTIAFVTLAASAFSADNHAHSENCSHEEHVHHEKHLHSDCCSHGNEERNKPTHEEQCDHNKKNDADSHGEQCDHDHENHAGNLIVVTADEATVKNAGITTIRPRRRVIGSELSFPGRFELAPDASDTVASPVSGRLELKVKSLDMVKKGDILFTVSSPEIVSKKKEIQIIEKRLSVYRNLKTQNAELENALAVKKAELEAILFNCPESDGVAQIPAPKDGLVEKLLILNGTWVSTGNAIIELTDTKNLRFKALVSADKAACLKDGLEAKVGNLSGTLRLGIGNESGIVPVYVLFRKNIDALSGARAVAVTTIGKTGETAIAVPDSAIVEIGLQKYVFLRDAKTTNRFIATAVTAGTKSGGWTDVTGLPSDHCEIVSAGAYELKLAASASESKPAGHFHADGTFHEGEH